MSLWDATEVRSSRRGGGEAGAANESVDPVAAKDGFAAAVLVMAERDILLVGLGLAPGFIAPFSNVGVRFWCSKRGHWDGARILRQGNRPNVYFLF